MRLDEISDAMQYLITAWPVGRFKSNYGRLIYVARLRVALFHGDLGRAINR